MTSRQPFKCSLWLVLPLFLLTAAPTEATTLVLDPVYSVERPQVAGCDSLAESALTLELAARIQELAKRQRGIDKVVATRTGDYPMSWRERATLANSHKEALFLSLQLENSPTDKTHGVRLYALLPDLNRLDSFAATTDALQPKSLDSLGFFHLAASEQLVTELEAAFLQHRAVGARAMRVSTLRGAYLALVGIDAPAVIVGLGFVTNQRDCERLRDPRHLDELADMILGGLKSYLKNQGRNL